MKALISALFLLAASPAFGSYLESCEFTVKVEETVGAATLNGSVQQYTTLAKLTILDARDQGSHVDRACIERIGTEELIVVDTDTVVQVGDELTIDYFYVNNFTPDGVRFSERWTIVD